MKHKHRNARPHWERETSQTPGGTKVLVLGPGGEFYREEKRKNRRVSIVKNYS